MSSEEIVRVGNSVWATVELDCKTQHLAQIVSVDRRNGTVLVRWSSNSKEQTIEIPCVKSGINLPKRRRRVPHFLANEQEPITKKQKSHWNIDIWASYLCSNNSPCEKISFMSTRMDSSQPQNFVDVDINISLHDYLQVDCDLLLNALRKNPRIHKVHFDFKILQSNHFNRFNHLNELNVLNVLNVLNHHESKCKKLMQNVSELPSLTDLSISNCKCPAVTMEAFKIRKNEQLEKLAIIDCANLDCQALFKSVCHEFLSLDCLELHGVHFGLDECEMLWNALDTNKGMSSIRQLSLFDNDICDEACHVLAKIMSSEQKIALDALVLCRNLLSDDGLEVLLDEGLHHNSSISYFDFAYNEDVTETGWKMLLGALKSNKILALESVFLEMERPDYINEEIKFYLNLNKAGRRYFINGQNIGNTTIHRKEQWILSLRSINSHLASLYYFISNYVEYISSNSD